MMSFIVMKLMLNKLIRLTIAGPLLFIAFLLPAAGPASAGEVTKNSTQPHELTDKLEPPADCANCHSAQYRDWAGGMMGNDFRDPSFLALLSISEQDTPGIGDYCLRCHGAGWFEGKSEPPGGDFFGRSFEAAPAVDRESIPLCDLCHRLQRVGKRTSRFDGKEIAEGNGSVYISPDDPWKGGKHPLTPLHKTGEMCGSCHDVSNPLLMSDNDRGINQPLERTYTEWKYSFFGENDFTCQKCHPPMKFPGAQTWLLYPGMAELYPDMDAGWAEAGYKIPADRSFALRQARERNEQLMRQAADVGISAPERWEPGEPFKIEVQVTNATGHRLPTGFAEGRQLWLHIRVTDARGELVFEDGRLDADGALIRSDQTKVYEQKAGFDGEKSFHFAKLTEIYKDNRIPPRGFNKKAYAKEGAFIVGADYKDGEHWDVTPYVFDVPADAAGPLKIEARLNYETYSKEYIDWLRETDKTSAANFGGPAAATPDGSKTWGEVTYKIWAKAAKGKPILTAEAVRSVPMAAAAGLPWRSAAPALVVVLIGAGLARRWLVSRGEG